MPQAGSRVVSNGHGGSASQVMILSLQDAMRDLHPTRYGYIQHGVGNVADETRSSEQPRHISGSEGQAESG